MGLTLLLSILAFLGTTISSRIHDRQEVRDRLITNAEKLCFEAPQEQRDCTLLNEVTKRYIMKKVKVKSGVTGSSVTVESGIESKEP